MSKMTKIRIAGEFTDLNKYIRAERANKYAASAIKKKETQRVIEACKGVATDFQYPVLIVFEWTTKDKRKDPDNVAFAKKFILDGLVKGGVLDGDSPKYIESFRDEFDVDKDACGVLITIV